MKQKRHIGKGKEKVQPLPIGVVDFKEAVSHYYYVDKTLLIRDIIDLKPKVTLFARPRRFGKTLNMDMLRVFFENTAEDTSVYFVDKNIWKEGAEYQKMQGKYPVIFLSFKDVKFFTWEETLNSIQSVIAAEFMRHGELSTSVALSIYDHQYYESLVTGNVSKVELSNAILRLSTMLHAHYKMAPMVIIDEYDTPVQEGYLKGFYDQVISFMRNLFSAGLKDNLHISLAFMTGILRVAKESIFSGLNNIMIFSIMDDQFGEYFGFTEDEVRDMAEYYGHRDQMDEIKMWYDGYCFGEYEIYNPWSVISYFAKNCIPTAFWQSTGSNDIIGEILEEASSDILKQLGQLMEGKSILTYVDTGVIYPEIRRNPSSIFSFLLVAGYLKIEKLDVLDDGNFMCMVRIPNKEISYVYEREILTKLEQVMDTSVTIEMKQAMYEGNAEKLGHSLRQLLSQSVSFFDTANESFYHGLMLGLCAVMNGQYTIRSNRESGMGRFDLMLIPLKHNLPGICIEMKSSREPEVSEEQLDKLAEDALVQIREKEYTTELEAQGCSMILSYGIAFCGKRVRVKQNTV